MKKYELNRDWNQFSQDFTDELKKLNATDEEIKQALDIAFADVTDVDDVSTCAHDILIRNVRGDV